MSKRKLSQDEINYILDFIEKNPYIPKDISDFLFSKTRDQFSSQLEKILIYPEMIDSLKENIKAAYYSTLIQPGEAVGVLTAQSIGEKQTQSTLNSFHKAGSAENQPIVSKFSELLNATSKPKAPMYTVYFKDNNDSISSLRNMIGHSIVQLTLKKLSEKIDICVNKKSEKWYSSFFAMKEKKEDFNDCISIKINTNLLYEYKLQLKEICDKIEEIYIDSYCIYSPDCFGQIDIFFDTSNISLPENKIGFVTQDNEIEIYLEEVCKPNLEKLIICGIQGIMNMYFLQEKNGKWIIETDNIREKVTSSKIKTNKNKAFDSHKRFVKLLAHPSIDYTKCLSNNIWDIYKIFGIEAVRQYMIDEFCKIMEGINPCHVMLLVDKMTFNGSISSISRYSMRTDDSIFCRASFEETLDNLLSAGINGQDEQTNGISASIICGKRANIGTGYCSLAIDVDKLIK